MLNLYIIKSIFQNIWSNIISVLEGDFLLQDIIKILEGFYKNFIINGPFDLYIILSFFLLFTIFFKKILTKLRDS
ncbi:hypothetical protein EOM09_02215 [bacterium]|nr:hypothetical protein [bacterium]